MQLVRFLSLFAFACAALAAEPAADSVHVNDISSAEASAAEALRATQAAHAAKSVPWSYCASGPSSWSDLDESFSKCGEGLKQSPINIVESEVETSTALKPLDFGYASSPASLVNDGHVLSVSMDPGSILTVDGNKQFELLEVKIHTPGLHQVNGKATDAEILFVHKSSSQDRVTVAVRAVLGEANAELDKVVKLFPKHAAVAKVPSVSFDPSNLLPASKQYWSYSGSDTAPPCAEENSYKVLRSTITIGAEQLAVLTANIPKNNRPVQMLHGRAVVVSAYAEDANGKPAKAAEADKPVSVNYSWCEDGPKDWANLSPLFSLCKDGEHQSPVNIIKGSVAAVGADEPLKYHIENTPLVLENVARSIQINSNGKSSIEARGKKFVILQAHFTTPSGHLIDGVPSAMELSITAKSADNQLLVLSVLINEGAENAAVAEFVDSLPRAKISVDLQRPFDLARLLPKTAQEGYYHYSGSLAAPPCSENVERYVLQEPIEVSTQQLVRFQALLGHNARPTQLLYGRKVTMPESGFVASGKDEVKIKTLAEQARTASTNAADKTTNN